ncbi:MAG: hypothetical protein ACREPY_13245 [Rhodanobacteraceae bacterium]
MKPLRTLLATGIVVALAVIPAVSSAQLWGQKPQVLPVVVHVDAQGKVTDINPAMQLRPWLRKLLIKQIDAWIVKPLTVKGHPVASRFIIEVAMHTKPTSDGKYDASFVYVKSLPLAYGGPQHWNVINGGLQFALVPNVLQQPGIYNRISGTPYEPSSPYSGYAASAAPAIAGAAAGRRNSGAPAAGGAPHGKP